jgi:hypothetical protein
MMVGMWWLYACAAPPPTAVVTHDDTSAPVGDTAGDTAADTAIAPDTGDGLVGEALDPPLDPPVFAVYDQAGVLQTEASLDGHPTVLWFFREAEGST